MSDVGALVSKLRSREIKLWLEDDRLKCSAPKDALDEDTRRQLAQRKAELVAFLQESRALADPASTIVPIKRSGSRPPIFAVSGHGGDVFYLRTLGRDMDPAQPLIGIQPPGLDGREPLRTLEELARFQIGQIRNYRPHGPYLLAGHCAGGALAFEIAHQLTNAGESVAMLALIGAPFPSQFSYLTRKMVRVRRILRILSRGSLGERFRFVLRKIHERSHPPEEAAGISREVMAARDRVEDATVQAVYGYSPKPYPGRVDVFVAGDWWHSCEKWKPFGLDVRMHDIGADEIDDILLGGHTQGLAASLAAIAQGVA